MGKNQEVMKKAGKQLRNHVRDQFMVTSIELFNRLTLRMPVDMGVARASTVLVNHPDSDIPTSNSFGISSEQIKAHRNTKRKGGNPGPLTSEVYDITQFTVNGELVAWVVNNLPYIKRLNDGHSKQAPKKFIETSISEVMSMLG